MMSCQPLGVTSYVTPCLITNHLNLTHNFIRDMTGPDRRSGAMMSKVGNPQIYEDHEQRYVSLPHIQFEHPH